MYVEIEMRIQELMLISGREILRQAQLCAEPRFRKTFPSPTSFVQRLVAFASTRKHSITLLSYLLLLGLTRFEQTDLSATCSLRAAISAFSSLMKLNFIITSSTCVPGTLRSEGRLRCTGARRCKALP